MWKKIKDFFKVESLTTRTRLAFMSIVLLLLFSGVMSLMELQRVSNDTEKILNASKSNADLAQDMREALNQQNKAMIYMAIKGDEASHHRTTCEQSIRELHQLTRRAKDVVERSETPHAADSLINYSNDINTLSKSYVNGEIEDMIIADHELDSLSTYSTNDWYMETYLPMYENVSRHIEVYSTGVHNNLAPEVNNLNHTARRTVTPVFITLIVMIVIVLMYYFFIMITIVKPILRINRSLGTYLAFKTPFDDSIRSSDEIRTMRDRIAALISRIR